jgi:lauroyl/myristoyl acyltransferase
MKSLSSIRFSYLKHLSTNKSVLLITLKFTNAMQFQRKNVAKYFRHTTNIPQIPVQITYLTPETVFPVTATRQTATNRLKLRFSHECSIRLLVRSQLTQSTVYCTDERNQFHFKVQVNRVKCCRIIDLKAILHGT